MKNLISYEIIYHHIKKLRNQKSITKILKFITFLLIEHLYYFF